MGVRKAIVVVAFGAALLPSLSSAQGMSADAVIAACQSRAKLTDQWNPLQAERDQLAQTLRNFGFENTVAEQQALGDKAGDILRDNGINARKDLMDKTASEAATAMQGFLKNLQTGAGRALSDAERGQLQQLARRLPQQARESIMRIAQEPRIPLPGAAVWGQALEGVGIAATLYKVATTESAARQAWEGFMGAVGVVNAPMGLVVANLDYAANNLWSLGQLAWTQQQIKSLTNATEADLRLMKNTTDRMKTVAQQLGKIRAALGALPPCDSTQLVRGDLGPTPQTPQVPTPEPENTSGNSANGGGGGGGMGAGSYVGIAAAGVGAAVGGKMLADYQKKVQCNQYETEMDSKVNSVVNAANALTRCGSNVSCQNTQVNAVNSAVSSMLTTAGNWCTCLGPDAASELSSSEKAEVRDALNALRGLGVNPGTLPACFR